MWRVVSGAERSDKACRQATRRGEQSEAMGADSVFEETIQSLVFAHVFEEVFLTPSVAPGAA
jgi:hypothetical protein